MIFQGGGGGGGGGGGVQFPYPPSGSAHVQVNECSLE